MFAICHLSVVPVRANSTEKSEQVTQLLFGEMVEVIDRKGKAWLKVRCTWDNQIGWVDSRQLKMLTDSEHLTFEKNFAYNLDVIHALMSNTHNMPITIGARLPNFDGMKFGLGDQVYTFSGQAVFPKDLETSAELVIKLARRYLFAPYQWGGRSPLGIDAAGLAQMVFRLIGISLHREANKQVHQGESVDFVEQSNEGDLAFFENKKGNISHVGIILNDGHIIHAAGQVRIDKIDHYGIFNEETNRYSHKLRVIKRILPKQSEKKSNKTSNTKSKPKQVEMF